MKLKISMFRRNSRYQQFDAFHMLSDFVALSLGFFVHELANVKNVNPKYTFGYGRAEVVGAFANAIFLAALTFDIILDAIDRFILVPTQIKNPQILMAVGLLGLVINICGLILFCSCDIGHGHSHEGFSHGHSHGGADEENLNMKAVALHLLGDAFGSVIVMISAGIILAYEDSECSYMVTHQVVNGSMPLPSGVNLTDTPLKHYHNGCWVYYLDPVLSVLISILILWSVVPIIKRSSMILLEACSKKHINVKSIQTQLTAMVGSSQNTDLPWTFTDLKVWDLNPSNTYCCVTIQFYKLPDDLISSEFNTITSYMESINSTQRSIKTVLEANYRIHHIILNQEFKRVNTRSEIPSLEKLLDDRKYLSDDDSNSGERDTIAMHDVGHGHSH